MVKLILFVHKDTGNAGTLFLETVKNQFHGIKIETCEQVADLHTLIKRPGHNGLGKRIFVLYIDNENRLSQVCDHAILFEGTKVVALVPESSGTYLKKINRLYPRYLGTTDEAFGTVCHVLRKMIEN